MATAATEQNAQGKFSFTSSIAADVWHQKTNPEAFEWWYFDALSDDGRDGIVIIFLDNFIFSPRYNAKNSRQANLFGKLKNKILGKSGEHNYNLFPAVAFIYYRDGKAKYRAINEFAPEEFSASVEKAACAIGGNSFRLESAPYGSGYLLKLSAKLRKNRHLEAHFEWLSVESDFTPEKEIDIEDAHIWNLAVARADVTGRISIADDAGKNLDVVHFRGTGYHDHNLDNRWLPTTVQDWQWGRAHFNDATAVFYRYKEHGERHPVTKLFVVKEGKLTESDAAYEESKFKRDKFGVKYPTRLNFIADNNTRLSVKPIKVIDSSFFYLRFLSEMTLTCPDGTPHKIVGITEHLAPKALKYRWLDWLTNMRIGRHGKGSFLP